MALSSTSLLLIRQNLECPKMKNNRVSLVLTTALTLTMQALVSAHTYPKNGTVDLCEVVASADKYNRKVLSIEGVLFPSEHSLALYSPSCKPRAGFNVTIQAILPKNWESSPHGKQLRKVLRHGHSARVNATGVFETGGFFGPDGAKFRFAIREIWSVEEPDKPDK